MAQERPWVHGELPWLSGPLYRVSSDAWPAVDEFLTRWNYQQVELNGRAMTSNFLAHSELHAAFGFPEWCGHNWDAFNDCFGDYVEENDGALIAVVWRDIAVAAREAPANCCRSWMGPARLHVREHPQPRSRHRLVREHGHLRHRGWVETLFRPN